MQGLGFTQSVVPGGYAWWYVDALSADGKHGITLIAFLGSVFSPYYAWARRRGSADPLHHCALNVNLYGGRGKRWTMTERGRRSVERSASILSIGPSELSWNGDCLSIRIDEVTAPVPSRIRGTVRVRPSALLSRPYTLDTAGRHRWTPLAPAAWVEVELERPSLRWAGAGYLDSNDGDKPLEQDFVEWDWCRAPLQGGAAVLYNAMPRSGAPLALALAFGKTGSAEHVAAPPRAELPSSFWRVRRRTRCDAGGTPVLQRTLEDAPFYARSIIATRLLGQNVTAVHESLSLDRFRAAWVQAMLPFRIPRRF